MTVIAAICIFLVVVLIHELGHFSVAKLVGIRVNEFSIGMGPKILQKEKGDTKYSLRLIPMGGYVSMEGEDDSSQDPRSFNNASVVSRIGVIVAGPIMNFILSIVILTIVAFRVGTPTTKIESVIEDSPAYLVEIKSGDRIRAINSESMESWGDISKNISSADPRKDLVIELERDNKPLSISVRPGIDELGNRVIGIVPAMEKSFIKAVKSGFTQTGDFIKSMFKFFELLLKRKVSSKDLSGPVGVVKEIDTAAKMGINVVLFLLAFISVNLGFFNLLPIPALDGGRLVFLIVELFRGRPIDEEKEGMVHFVGFILLIGLMLFVTYKDIVNL